MGFTWNTVCKKFEKKKIENVYGRAISVAGKKMVVEISGEENGGIPIVLLPGWGCSSPVLEFKPLYDNLSKEHRVITIEPLGYGLSDGTSAERSIENIVDELHECMQVMGEKQYYLMGHSISGIYSLYWSNKYPNEVVGIIGIDPSVPGMTEKENNPFPISITSVNKIDAYLQKVVNDFGIARLKSINNPEKVVYADHTYSYSDEEMELFRKLSIDCSYNNTVMNELNCMEKNLKIVDKMKFSKDLPVLEFVSKENCDMMPQWEKLHKDVIEKEGIGKILVLDGSHYLHFEQLDKIVNEVNTWMKNIDY